MTDETRTTNAAARDEAVRNAIDRIREIERDMGVTREALERMKKVLLELAARAELFPRQDFPPPKDGDMSVRYILTEDDDRRFALYMNSILPGKKTPPHNHTTWAIVVAVEGEEINYLYDRLDDGSVPGKAEIVFDRSLTVEPGNGIALMPDDIHHIEVVGDRPTLHFHLYGDALETLSERLSFDPDKGTCEKFETQSKSLRQESGQDSSRRVT